MRLIDADELRFEIVKYFAGLPIQCHYDMLKMVDEAPTVDTESIEVESVTRCKDCIYYRQEIDMCDEPYSTAHNVVHEDDYCSRAERKEKE